MKKFCSFVAAFVLLLTMSATVFAAPGGASVRSVRAGSGPPASHAPWGTGSSGNTGGSGNTGVILYVDDNSGVEFAVPARWSLKTKAPEDGSNFVYIILDDDPNLYMEFWSIDVWTNMSRDARAGKTRSQIDNSTITPGYVAESFSVDVNEISTVSYGGKEYYRFVQELPAQSSEDGRLDKLITLFRVENGYFFIFDFSGDSSSKYYDDFEAVIKSVYYPAPKGAAPSGGASSGSPSSGGFSSGSASLGNSASDFLSGFSWVVLILILLAVALCALVPFLVSRRKKDKPTEAGIKAAAEKAGPASPGLPAQTPMRKVLYCRRCGARLVDGSEFCHKCGTSVQKGDER